MMPPVRISFIVLSFNSARVLERCVRSLVAQADSCAHDEIWVVENGSTDASPHILRSLELAWPNVVKTVYLDRNCGTTVSRNIAIGRATGRYIAIVDSDIEAPAGTAKTLIAHLDGHSAVGLIAPRLLHPDGRLQLSADQFPTLAHKARRYFSLRSMEERINRLPPPVGIREVDYAISAFWLLRREVIDRVGLLDERIFCAPEDVDYCLRLWKAGYSVLYDATTYAVHDAQEISRGAPWKRSAIDHLAGLLYLFRKHRYMLSRRSVYDVIDRARAAARHPADANVVAAGG